MTWDPNILNRNVIKLINNSKNEKGKRFRQEDLGKIIGCQQSNISQALNENDPSHNFSVAALVDIAIHFHVSTDELLGISPTIKNDDDITLSDILQMLFDIEDIVGPDFKIEFPQGPSDENKNKVKCTICFDNKTISNKLKEWDTLRKMKNIQDPTIENIFRIWKNEVLKDGANLKKEWMFLNREDYEDYLIKTVIDFGDYPLPFDTFSEDIPEIFYSDDNYKMLVEINESIEKRADMDQDDLGCFARGFSYIQTMVQHYCFSEDEPAEFDQEEKQQNRKKEKQKGKTDSPSSDDKEKPDPKEENSESKNK